MVQPLQDTPTSSWHICPSIHPQLKIQWAALDPAMCKQLKKHKKREDITIISELLYFGSDWAICAKNRSKSSPRVEMSNWLYGLASVDQLICHKNCGHYLSFHDVLSTIPWVFCGLSTVSFSWHLQLSIIFPFARAQMKNPLLIYCSNVPCTLLAISLENGDPSSLTHSELS